METEQESVFDNIIYAYTRAQAIEDGVLVDLTTLSPSDTRLYKWPVACTSAVFSLIEDIVPHDKDGFFEIAKVGPWIWDLCWMSIKNITRKFSDSEHLFKVIIGNKAHTLKCSCSPGDTGEPVITIMMEDED